MASNLASGSGTGSRRSRGGGSGSGSKRDGGRGSRGGRVGTRTYCSKIKRPKMV